ATDQESRRFRRRSGRRMARNQSRCAGVKHDRGRRRVRCHDAARVSNADRGGGARRGSESRAPARGRPSPHPRKETVMSNPLVEVQKYGQSIWYDNIRRGIITSGQLQAMIDNDGLRGITSNPAIFEKAIDDIQWALDLMHPVFESTGGRDGYVSFEVAPNLANDTEQTIAYARRVHRTIGRENILIKVPGTPAGMPAIATLIGEGINVNVTLLFAVDAYEACAHAYMEGLEKLAARRGDVAKAASVASFFISRIDTLVDAKLEKLLASTTDPDKRKKIEGLFGKVAVANGKVAYERYHELIASPRWKALAAKGARTQRVLWA